MEKHLLGKDLKRKKKKIREKKQKMNLKLCTCGLMEYELNKRVVYSTLGM